MDYPIRLHHRRDLDVVTLYCNDPKFQKKIAKLLNDYAQGRKPYYSLDGVEIARYGANRDDKDIFEMTYPYLHARSCVVIGNIHETKERKEWWNQLLTDERVRISFDLYDIGLVLFEEKRFKQNYKVNFF